MRVLGYACGAGAWPYSGRAPHLLFHLGQCLVLSGPPSPHLQDEDVGLHHFFAVWGGAGAWFPDSLEKKSQRSALGPGPALSTHHGGAPLLT